MCLESYLLVLEELDQIEESKILPVRVWSPRGVRATQAWDGGLHHLVGCECVLDTMQATSLRLQEVACRCTYEQTAPYQP